MCKKYMKSLESFKGLVRLVRLVGFHAVVYLKPLNGRGRLSMSTLTQGDCMFSSLSISSFHSLVWCRLVRYSEFLMSSRFVEPLSTA